jgi:hypothetical protein
MTMLTPYLLNEFHRFSVYLILEPGMQFGAFQRTKWQIQLKIKKSVTTGVHRPKPWLGGPSRVIGRPHLDWLAPLWRPRLKTWRLYSS